MFFFFFLNSRPQKRDLCPVPGRKLRVDNTRALWQEDRVSVHLLVGVKEPLVTVNEQKGVPWFQRCLPALEPASWAEASATSCAGRRHTSPTVVGTTLVCLPSAGGGFTSWSLRSPSQKWTQTLSEITIVSNLYWNRSPDGYSTNCPNQKKNQECSTQQVPVKCCNPWKMLWKSEWGSRSVQGWKLRMTGWEPGRPGGGGFQLYREAQLHRREGRVGVIWSSVHSCIHPDIERHPWRGLENLSTLEIDSDEARDEQLLGNLHRLMEKNNNKKKETKRLNILLVRGQSQVLGSTGSRPSVEQVHLRPARRLRSIVNRGVDPLDHRVSGGWA